MSVLSFEANTITFTAEGQLYLCVFLTQREQASADHGASTQGG